MTFFSFNVLSVNSIECISMKNQESKAREVIINNDYMTYNKDKCRCECLINKKCDNNFVLNPSNCKWEYKKKAAHLFTEECEEIENKLSQ